jgi:Domain of unknown function (DUF932)
MLPPRTPKKARKPLPRKPSNHFTGAGGATNTPGTKTQPNITSLVMSLNSNYLPKARGTVAISDEELRCSAPSIFASQPIEGVSNRYSFLPTSSILKGMRENGWVPVRAEQQSVRTEARRGFQKHLIRFARIEHLDSWQKNQVRPEVVLLNSHDKSSAYQLHCGLFRLVCSNGLVVALC